MKELLQDYLDQGLKVDQIAKRLKTSVSNVYVLLHRNGLSMKNGVDRAIAILQYSDEHGIDAAMTKFEITRDNCHTYRSRGRKKLIRKENGV